MGMEDTQSWTNRAILRETEEQMARNQKRAIQLLKLMNGDDDDDDEDGDGDDRSSGHNSAIAEEEEEHHLDNDNDNDNEGAEIDGILMINMDHSHSDLKYDDKGDVVASDNHQPPTNTNTNTDTDTDTVNANTATNTGITNTNTNTNTGTTDRDRDRDRTVIDGAAEMLCIQVEVVAAAAGSDAPGGPDTDTGTGIGKTGSGPRSDNSGRSTSTPDEIVIAGLITLPSVNVLKMDDEDSDDNDNDNDNDNGAVNNRSTRSSTGRITSPLERLRSGRFSRTGTRRFSHLSAKSSPSSRPGTGTRPGTAQGDEESTAIHVRNFMLSGMGDRLTLQLPQDTQDTQDNYSEQLTNGKVVNDYLFQDSLPKEFWYIFEVRSTDNTFYCT